jgi:hypothetical protein
MAGAAGLGVLSLQRSRVESGTVRIEPPSSKRRVAGETVSLGVAGYTALQVLACRLSVIK